MELQLCNDGHTWDNEEHEGWWWDTECRPLELAEEIDKLRNEVNYWFNYCNKLILGDK